MINNDDFNTNQNTNTDSWSGDKCFVLILRNIKYLRTQVTLQPVSLRNPYQSTTFKYNITVTSANAVSQLAETPYYKQEGRVFDFRWCHWDSSLT